MATSLIIHANVGTSDVALGVTGSSWQEIDVDNDRFLFSAGSDVIKDGEPSPSDTQLNQAGILITGSEITVDKYFLDDNSANELKEITNMGSGNKRYVLAFQFNGLTVSEPVLEMWDDTDMDSIDIVSLGAGTASSSWYRAICTTDALPGVAWTGSRIAGSSDGYYLNLNAGNGALSSADVLYAQMKILIPATQDDAGVVNPILAIKFSTI